MGTSSGSIGQSPRRVLVVHTGTDSPELRALHGESPDWFKKKLEPMGIDTAVVKAFKGERLPSYDDYDGIIGTGSPAMVTDRAKHPWMQRTSDFYLEAAEHGVPVLGVCFSHQLMGQGLGGSVAANPRGTEEGTLPVQLTKAGRNDPLFEGLPPTIDVQLTHSQLVDTLPPDAVLLATNSMTPVQAYAVGDKIRGLQFHPEMPAKVIRNYVEREGNLTFDEKLEILSNVRETPYGKRILENWNASFLQAAR